MRTTGRNAEALPVDEVARQVGALAIDVRWDVRLVDLAGTPLTAANWLYYGVPPAALLTRSRSGQIDGQTWTCDLEILASALPGAITPLRYWRLEIDRVYPGGARFPYFTGTVLDVGTGWAQQDGAAVKTYSLHCEGVIARAKGFRVNDLVITPAFTAGYYQCTGVLERVRQRVDTVLAAGGVELVPGRALYNITHATDGLSISQNSDMSAPYTGGGTDYTLAVSAHVATVTWAGGTNPAEPRYYQFYRPAFFGIPAHGGAVAAWFKCPYGRSPYDLYHTQVSAYSAGPPVTVTPTDPDAYKSGAGLLDPAGQVEYLTLTDSDGTEETEQISSVSAAGVITLAAAPSSFTPVAGDKIRVSTTEMVAAWDLLGYKSGVAPNTTYAPILVRTATGPGGGEWPRALWQLAPAQGMVLCRGIRNFAAADAVWVDATKALEDSSSDASQVIRTLLSTSTSLFAAKDITATASQTYVRNYTRYDTDISDVLETLKRDALAPNVYLHDERDGTITVKPYTQASSATAHLGQLAGIDVEELQEPVTAVVVIGVGQAENRAATWFHSQSGFTNPERITDGDKGSSAAQTAGATPATVLFHLPVPTPTEVYPVIDRIEITGQGFFSAKITQGVRDFQVPGWQYRPIGTTTQPGAETIPFEVLAQAIAPASLTSEMWLTITLYAFDDGTAGACSEIEVWVANNAAWRAAMSDVTTSAPTGWQPTDTTQFGTVWWQADTAKRESYRYAPAAWTKRNQVLWNAARASQKHRTQVLRIPNLGLQDCRTFAETYMDEYLRNSQQYRFQAPIDDRLELGDTVSVSLPDGTNKLLLLWGMQDSGGVEDHMASYAAKDYSL